ncbi:MAG: hypothetical protein RLN74_05925, partial [Ilumatobacter fluminis]
MSATREQALATLTGPGGAFEIVPTDVQGIEMPVFRNAPPTMRAVFEQSLEFGDRTFLVYDDLRWTYADHGDRVRRLAHHLREMAGVR